MGLAGPGIGVDRSTRLPTGLQNIGGSGGLEPLSIPEAVFLRCWGERSSQQQDC